MLNRITPRGCLLLIAAAITFPFGTVYLYMLGSAAVTDTTGGVESAYVVGGAGEQRMRRLWPGYFFAVPGLEGLIEVRCRDGSRKQAGYVTAARHTRVKVEGDRPCERLLELH